jgi:hypothetical protein
LDPSGALGSDRLVDRCELYLWAVDPMLTRRSHMSRMAAVALGSWALKRPKQAMVGCLVWSG